MPADTAAFALPAQLALRIEDGIRAGVWPSGKRLPPERTLARDLGVGRSTLRLALDLLVARGLVARHQGRGTFVAARHVEADTSAHFTLSSALLASGGRSETRVLDVSEEPAGRTHAAELGIAPDAPVMRIRRLRLLDGTPVVLETAILPRDLFPRLAAADLETRSLYEVLAREHGRTVAGATETVEAVDLGAADAALLDARRGSPALLVRRTTTDDAGVVIEVAEALLRGDRARFRLRRRPSPPLAGMVWPARPPEVELETREPVLQR